MKRTLIAIALCGAASYACAQTELSPVTVERANFARLILACTPPNDAPNCSYFHYLLRENFSEREIGMLFGGATGYQEYPTGFETTREHYAAFLRDLAENGAPVASSNEYPTRAARYARSW
jgi:hypothetical protein